MNTQNKLADMPIQPLLYTMAVPLMLSLLVQSLYNIVDSMFVAKLSETALTAASLVYSIQFLMIAVGVGTAVGLNALLSRKIGQHKPEEACQAATTGLFLMLITSLIFSITGIFFSDTIASRLTSEPQLQELCRQYLSINLVYCWGIFLQTYGQRLLQAVGDTILSMISLIIGAVWLGIAPLKERMETVRTVLNIPENLDAFAIIPCGYPEAVHAQQDRFDKQRIHYVL